MTSEAIQALWAQVLVVASLIFDNTAGACTVIRPSDYVQPSLEEFAESNYKSARYVAEVKVTSVVEKRNWWTQVVRFKLLKNYKGNLKRREFVFMRDICDATFESYKKGDRTLVFLSEEFGTVYGRDPFIPYRKSEIDDYIKRTKETLAE
jgi:hypothetical protein